VQSQGGRKQIKKWMVDLFRGAQNVWRNKSEFRTAGNLEAESETGEGTGYRKKNGLVRQEQWTDKRKKSQGGRKEGGYQDNSTAKL